MNINLVKGLVIFMVGFGLGAVAAKMALKREYEELVQEEVESLRETAARRKGLRDEKEEVVDVKKTAKEIHKKLAKRYGGSDREQQELSEIEQNYGNHPTDGTPYAISLEEFSEEMDHFEKSTIYYYDEDDTLADEQEEMIQDVLAIIGPSVLDHLQQAKSDVVYVRNEKMQIDYEIIVLDKSYAQTVSGIIPEE